MLLHAAPAHRGGRSPARPDAPRARGTGGERGPRPYKSSFRPDIQGLRAVAILLVVLYHAKLGVGGGYVEVDVFFVISGFLTTRQLADELESRRRISFLGFYARRVRRILPAATVLIVATTVTARAVLTPEAAHRALQDALAAVFYGANYRFAVEGANYLNSTLPPSPLQHFWSLGVEEQFYLVWPVALMLSSLVWLTGRRRAQEAYRRPPGEATGEDGRSRPVVPLVCLTLAVIGVVSFLVSLHETVVSPSWAYYSIFTRAWELAAGSLAALLQPAAARLGRGAAIALSWLGP
ncbi:MAG: acyltransferase family protein [Acidimicrobiales bacterium]